MKSLDRFIKSVRMEVAKEHNFSTHYEVDAFFIGLEEASKDNQEALEKRDKMLRNTVAELAEAKRLLKLAVEDMKDKNFCKSVCSRDSFACRVSDTCDFKWRYADEAKKVIGDD